jgi:hypothetical protein
MLPHLPSFLPRSYIHYTYEGICLCLCNAHLSRLDLKCLSDFVGQYTYINLSLKISINYRGCNLLLVNAKHVFVLGK